MNKILLIVHSTIVAKVVMDVCNDVENNGGIDTEDSYGYIGSDGDCHYNKSTIGAGVSEVVNLPNGSMIDLYQALATVGPFQLLWMLKTIFKCIQVVFISQRNAFNNVRSRSSGGWIWCFIVKIFDQKYGVLIGYMVIFIFQRNDNMRGNLMLHFLV